jgi:hypothetical protein
VQGWYFLQWGFLHLPISCLQFCNMWKHRPPTTSFPFHSPWSNTWGVVPPHTNDAWGAGLQDRLVSLATLLHLGSRQRPLTTMALVLLSSLDSSLLAPIYLIWEPKSNPIFPGATPLLIHHLYTCEWFSRTAIPLRRITLNGSLTSNSLHSFNLPSSDYLRQM